MSEILKEEQFFKSRIYLELLEQILKWRTIQKSQQNWNMNKFWICDQKFGKENIFWNAGHYLKSSDKFEQKHYETEMLLNFV